MTFLELAEKVLIEQKIPMTANEIWKTAVEKKYDKLLNSEGKTPSSTLGALIYVNAKDSPKSLFAKTDTRPKKFYLKKLSSVAEIIETSLEKEIVTKKKKFEYLEKDLHKFLTYYANGNMHKDRKSVV